MKNPDEWRSLIPIQFMGKKMIRPLLQVLALSLALLMPALQGWCAHHAVLIGIKDYPDAMPLYGPLNDVAAVKKVLVETYGFSGNNITVLLDRDATKSKILDTLSAIQARTRPEDNIFIYYSGHGTSDFNPETGFSMGKATGAILPYDFKFFPNDIEKTLDRLIVGRRDLRPIFEGLDKERNLLVVFDACFSGNATRARNRQPGIPKYQPLPFSSRRGRMPNTDAPVKISPYPYQNLVYISASDTTERAIDLPTGARYDGKAHGALTDALLMGLSGGADTNRNRVVTYQELYQFVKHGVQVYGHTPQIRTRASLDRPVFGKPGKMDFDVGISAGGPLVVNLNVKNRPFLENRISALSGIAASTGHYNLLVEEEQKSPVSKSAFSLYLPSGDRLCRVEREDQVIERIERFAKIRDAVNLKNPDQDFNVWMNAGQYEGKTVFNEGETVDLSIKSETDAYLLVFNVDPHGSINLIIPGPDLKETFLGKEETMTLREFEIFPPFGVEFIKLFAFKRKVDGLDQFSHTNRLKPGSSGYAELLRIIAAETRSGTDWAETSTQVVTLASIDDH